MNRDTMSEIRHWWRRRWWPARIRQLDRERVYWKHACRVAEERLTGHMDDKYRQEYE